MQGDGERATGRVRQKARTREAILAGARALIARGRPVTVAAAAAESGVSKATAYRYFSDPNLLAAEAGLAHEVQDYETVVARATDVRGRVLAVSIYFLDLALAHENEFRRFLARSLDARAAGGGAAPMVRGARRVEMFERALAGLEPPMDKDARHRLVRALCLTTAIEAMVALLDVANASPDEARMAVRDTVEALLDRWLP